MKYLKYLTVFFIFILLSISATGSLIDILKNRHSIKPALERIFSLKLTNINPVNPISNKQSGEVIKSDLSESSVEKNLTGDEHLQGFWTAAFDWPVIAVHANLMPGGKIFTFGSLAGEPINHKDHFINLSANKKIRLTDGRILERDVGEKQWAHHNVFWGADFDIWDPSQGISKKSHETIIDPIKVNSFCAVVRVLDDENIFILGGDEKPMGHSSKGYKDSGPDTQRATTKFNMKSKKLSFLSNLNYHRWYGSVVRLSDDRLIMFGGIDNANLTNNLDIERVATTPEILEKDKNGKLSWRVLENLKSNKFFGSEHLEWVYPKVFVINNDNIFGISYDKLFLIKNNSNFTNNSKYEFEIKEVGRIPLVQNPNKIEIDNQNPNTKKNSEKLILGSIGSAVGPYSSTVLIRENEILTLGGIEKNHFASNHVYSIQIDEPENPKVKKLSNMHYPRFNQNIVILPDGNIFVNGGNASGNADDANSFNVYTPELFEYEKNKWTKLKKTNWKRNYHSTSLLMKDGRILVSGGDVWNSQIFYPPYMFEKKRDGTLKFAKRPLFKLEKSFISKGEKKIFANIDKFDDIKKISILSAGSVTHAQPSELKYNDLKFKKISNSKIEITLSENLIGGFYILTSINNLGVPSISEDLIIK